MRTGLSATQSATRINRSLTELSLQGGEDDLDALLAKFKLQDEQQKLHTVELERPPSPRLFATFTPIPVGQVQLCKLHAPQESAPRLTCSLHRAGRL